MESIRHVLWQDREQAGRLLSRKLDVYRNTNALVVGIPRGGVFVAVPVAERLALPMEVMGCRAIVHPADSKRTIGSVSANEVSVRDDTRFSPVPQDYIYHQVVLHRNVLHYERDLYDGERKPPSFHYRTVILVDDVLRNSDSILACLREIRKQQPLKVVVAVPLVSAEAARVVRGEADDIVFLHMAPVFYSERHFFASFPKVADRDVKELLDASVTRRAKEMRSVPSYV